MTETYPEKRLIGYARVSTYGQAPRPSSDAARGALRCKNWRAATTLQREPSHDFQIVSSVTLRGPATTPQTVGNPQPIVSLEYRVALVPAASAYV
jgi:hypothetical protein